MRPSASIAPHRACPSSERLSQSKPPHSAHVTSPRATRARTSASRGWLDASSSTNTSGKPPPAYTASTPAGSAASARGSNGTSSAPACSSSSRLSGYVKLNARPPATATRARPDGRAVGASRRRERRRGPGDSRDGVEVARRVDRVGQPFERLLHRFALLDHRHEAEVPVAPGELVGAGEHAEHRDADRFQRLAQHRLVRRGCRRGSAPPRRCERQDRTSRTRARAPPPSHSSRTRRRPARPARRAAGRRPRCSPGSPARPPRRRGP